MDDEQVRRRRSIAVAVFAVQLAVGIASLISDRFLAHIGRSDLVGLHGEYFVFLLAFFSSAIVGLAIARSNPSHPVGWLFLGLSAVIISSAPFSSWFNWGHVARPGSLPATGAAATIDNSTWIPWFVLVALILLLTPTGSYLSPRWRLLGRVIAVCGTIGFVLSLVSDEPLDPPYDKIANPWAVTAFEPVSDTIRTVSVMIVAGGLILAGVSLLLRWRRARGDDRRQLLWLAMVVVPLPVFVVGAFVAAAADSNVGLAVSTGGFVALIPIAAGLSITRYHLYDVERILARTTTYVLLTLLLVGTYALVVLFGARGAQRWGTSPELAATVGALVVAVIAAPTRRGIQDLIDRRFNRRRYEAVRLIEGELADQRAGRDLGSLFRRAFDDPSVTVAYPGLAPGSWVSDTGLAPPAMVDWIDVERHDRLVARIGYDPARTDAGVVGAGARIAAAELDNAGLRAELARQLSEVESSRRRLAAAQHDERRRIERDLHDGAQQGLLALAMQLKSAHLSGDEERMRQALSEGASAAQSAVRELRELANGLHPAALADGGLSAALDDLARHSPVELRLDVDVPRMDPALEFTAWLVIGEALVNAQKHARATGIAVDVHQRDSRLNIRVCDDGGGAANPDGPGLRGMRDRVEAAGGTLVITSSAGAGTTIEAVLPCAS